MKLINSVVSPITNIEKTCLDHVWHNLTNTKRLCYVFHPYFADHNVISVMFDANIGQKPLEMKFRNFSESNIEAYSGNIDDIFVGTLSITVISTWPHRPSSTF